MKRIHVKKIMAGIALVAAMTTVASCAIHNAAVSRANAPFYLAYESEEVIRDQSKVATITSTGGLEIDGVVVTPKNMRAANTGFFKKQIVVADVLPGEHKVKITNDPSGNAVTMNAITFHFEAGRVYDIAAGVIQVFVKENTNPKVAAKIAENRHNNVFEKKQ
ncbi:MAG: hypothetical protein LBV32_07220 [Tannerellaceae bacterium]|jgi:hypothetical protein|nr:hypothetical protein [Tannerellaceae bacterium]